MPPPPTLPLQALFARLHDRVARGTLLLLALLLVGVAQPALAQDAPTSETPAAPAEGESVNFEADRVEYDSKSETVTASGNVVLRRDSQAVRADSVTWNRESGVIVATGGVKMVDEDGNALFTEKVELTDELKTGAMENLLLALREGARIAANSGRRLEDGNIILEQAAYTACAVQNEKGCPKDPTWRITAREVVYDEQRDRIALTGPASTCSGCSPCLFPASRRRPMGAPSPAC